NERQASARQRARAVERQEQLSQRDTTAPGPDGAGAQVVGDETLRRLDAYWRAANYLSVGQIYLYANPLLREPLKREHIKPRLLGHWGTTPDRKSTRLNSSHVK